MRPSPVETFAFPVLLADIGGTNARFAIVESPDAPFRDLGRTPTADHDDPISAIERFVLPRLEVAPRSAILAVAAVIEGEEISFTNNHWVLEPGRLRAALDLDVVVVVNDFEAQALALPHLGVDDLVPIGGGRRRPGATMAVIGPGTGLGVGLMVHARGVWIPVPGEGGHVDYAPRGPRETAIVEEVSRRSVAAGGDGRVSAETVLAGPGIARVHQAVRTLRGEAPGALDPAGVTAAFEAGDPAAIETMGFFAAALGRVAGDVALLSLPHGGVFLAGGIPPRVVPLLADGRFRAAFEDKWPYREMMASFVTAVVIHPLPAFVGLAAFARSPQTHVVALDGRAWV
ncbi:MAG: glucokinase [Phyllobacteriaceae bacterium]|nr:glucokinase [Phyllobacteriaceae bacterium]